MTTIRTAVPWDAACGEGPVWDPGLSAVHWVDILAGRIHTTTVSGTTPVRTTTLQLPTLVGAAVPRRDGGFVVAVTEGFAVVGPDQPYEVRADVLNPGTRMNDAKCDPAGRFLAGSTTMDFDPGAGALWALDERWSPTTVLTGLTLPNGMGWSPDGRTFYLVDTIPRRLFAFDYDLETGTPSRQRLIHEFDEADGMPDGMCVDAEGTLWVAMWGGGRVIRLDADGRRIEVVGTPVAQPSSCAFVGPDLDRLWITSARDGLDLAPDAVDGSVLVLDDPGVRGLAATPFAG